MPESDIHLRVYELTRRINKLLTSNNTSQLEDVLKERAVLIESLKGVSPPDDELRSKIIELEDKNKTLLEKKIQDTEHSINKLQFAKKTLGKYRASNKAGKLLNIKR